MAGGQEHRFLNGSDVPALALLRPEHPQRPPPAIPLRQFRSNPTNAPETAYSDRYSISSAPGNLRTVNSENESETKWDSLPPQANGERDELERYLEQFETLYSRIEDLRYDYVRLKNKSSTALFELFPKLVQVSVFRPFPNQAHIQHSCSQLDRHLQTKRWAELRSDLKIEECDALAIWYGLHPTSHTTMYLLLP